MASEKRTQSELAPIDLSALAGRLIGVLRRTWYIILAIALAGGAVSAYRAKKSYVPIYEASAFFSVDSGYSESDIFSSSYYDSRAAEQLAETFPYLLGTGVMSDLIMDALGRSYLGGTISAASVASSGMLVMRVTSPSAQDAFDILNAAIDCYPQLASYMVDDPQLILREEPVIPTQPARAFSYKAPFIKGFLISAALSLAIVFLISLFIRKVSDTEQLKKEFNRPVMAVLPQIEAKKRRRSTAPTVSVASNELFSESFKRLLRKLRRRLEDIDGRTVLVTSTHKGEGKTTLSVNLALTAATEGQRVVIVDADMRNQSVAQRLSTESCPVGLLELTRRRDADVLSALRQLDDTSLFYLSSDSVVGNRYSVDASGMSRVISVLKRHFDLVIIDTPPCAVVADTALLCRHADTVLYTVRAGVTSLPRLTGAVESLCERGGSVDAFVLNGADIREHRYGYGYGYKYGYGYGYKSRYGYGYGRSKAGK